MTTSRTDTLIFAAGVLYALLFAVFNLLPILSSFVFSWNSQRFPSWPLGEFDTHWYSQSLSEPGDFAALLRTLSVGAVAAFFATIIGFTAAYVDFRYRFRGKVVLLILILAPPTVPLLILGLAFLVYFSRLGLDGGVLTTMLAHIVICIPFGMALSRLRLAQMDKALEAAAWNLGASEWMAMRYVILPFVKPALLAAFLITMALSFDEFAIAWFVSGISETLPVRVLNMLAGAVSPRINVIGTATFSATIFMVVAAFLLMTRRKNENAGSI